ncbi:MAG TPA: beta-propeller fold lactonase family protein [Candidatus Binatia bacterium]|jgi:YVTN family beta-propeller protein|nr:beta-propeller fold lactonase family protein [Candidatus Binatia bacterium]
MKSAALLLMFAAGLVVGPSVATAQKKPKLATRSTDIVLFKNDTRLLVANREANSLSVLAVRKKSADLGTKIAEVTVGLEPRCVALGAKEKEAFVANAASGTVSVVALLGDRANEVIAEIPVGNEPRGCAAGPNGRLLFVANYTDGTVSIIDTKSRTVKSTINVGGQPFALAVTNDGDKSDDDETVFVTQFFAELIPNGPGEGFDDGKQAVVQFFAASGAGAVGRVTLSPLANAGFAGDRSPFCQQLNAQAHSDLFCPDTTVLDATNPVVAADPQGAYPNQLWSLLIRGTRVFVPSIAAGPEPPVKFNVNVQGLVHVIDTATNQEQANLTVNLNNQIKAEAQPANTAGSLVRVFANDIVALDGTADGSSLLIVSRGGNYVLRAAVDASGAINIGAPNVVRFQTGNLPTGIAVSRDGRRAYVNNEANLSVSVLDLTTNGVLTRDLATSTPPEPGSFAHAALMGRLVFHTALGTPDDGLSGTPLRDVVPVDFRNKASDNGWSSCGSCHPDGLADGVTWIFGTGPRQTLPLDAFFSKKNPADQRISNYSGVMGSITDFNNNSRGVQGGIGFAGDPPSPFIFQHGFTQGASEALDLETLWVQTIRPLNRPQPANVSGGRTIFESNCASCHGGAKWTKSQTIYLNNPTFDKNPAQGGVPFDPGLTNAGPQIVSYQILGNVLQFLEPIDTFDVANPLEIRSDGTTALGALGYNVPSLLGIAHHAPYFHDGSAPTLTDVFAAHALGGGTIASTLSAGQVTDLTTFLGSIDGGTAPFDSDADLFRRALVP